MSGRARIPRHRDNHVPGGPDPVGPVDSTDNDRIWGVRSVKPAGNEEGGLVLTATGAGGSIWSPSLSATGNSLQEIVLAHPCAYAFWPMDDVGPGARDLVNGNDLAENPTGTSVGQPVSTQGGFSFAYEQAGPFVDASVTSIQFNGDTAGFSSHGTILYKVLPAGNPTEDDWSFIAWIYNDDTDFGAVFSTFGGGDVQMSIQSGSGNISLVAITNSGSFDVTASSINATPGWHFVTATYDGASTIELFVDGVSYGTDTISGAVGMAGTFRIGAQGFGASGPTNFWRGRICQVGLFQCVLTDDEITNMAALSGASVDAGFVPTADGAGNWTWSAPTVAVTSPAGRYSTFTLGDDLAGTDLGSGTLQIDASIGVYLNGA